jgi:hypothetical protein
MVSSVASGLWTIEDVPWGDAKYLFDPATRKFIGAPNESHELVGQPGVQDAIAKGLRFLGESQ